MSSNRSQFKFCKRHFQTDNCLCEFHTVSESPGGKIWHPKCFQCFDIRLPSLPWRQQRLPSPHSQHPSWWTGNGMGGMSDGGSTAVRPSRFPAAPDPLTITSWPFSSSLTGHAFITVWKTDLKVGREGFSGFRRGGGKVLRLRRWRLGGRSGINVFGLRL